MAATSGKEIRKIARIAMGTIDEALVGEFEIIAEFVCEFPEQVARPPSRAEVGSEAYLEKLAERVSRGRIRKPLATPGTVPDPVVSLVLQHGYGIDENRLEQIKLEHQISMVAENLVGELLERYISSAVSSEGWIWASGEIIKAVDFIRKVPGGWELLQVKNRDNSENSSSSAIRNGTEIQKWYRTKSRTGDTKWEDFPIVRGHTHISLTEDGFRSFVVAYLGEPNE